MQTPRQLASVLCLLLTAAPVARADERPRQAPPPKVVVAKATSLEFPSPAVSPTASKIVAAFEQVRTEKAAVAAKTAPDGKPEYLDDEEEYEADELPIDELLKADAKNPSAVDGAGSCPAPPGAEANANDDDDSDEATVASGDDGDDDAGDGEEDVAGTDDGTVKGYRYSADISDEELEKLWKETRKTLGTLSVGFAHAGRIVNSEPFPCDGPWTVVTPEKAWGTTETIEYLKTVFEDVHKQFPDAYVRLNHISRKDGGYMRPHRSHQSGRDVDLGFFYRGGGMPGPRMKKRETIIDLEKNWALLKSVVTNSDVQMILVDRRVQAVLYDYALSVGEDRDWLDSLFHDGANSLVKHAKGHRDHFHVRFFNPRAQELGRRVQPLMAKSGELQQTIYHRIRRGETLGRIARKYGVTVSAVRRANGRAARVLRVGRSLVIPVRGPCTTCPLPPPVVVPPRHLPPEPHSEPVAQQLDHSRTLAAH